MEDTPTSEPLPEPPGRGTPVLCAFSGPDRGARDGPAPGPPSGGYGTFDEFFAANWPAALRLAGLLLQDADAGEDVAQEVLVAIYRSWGRAENPEAYLRTSITNACRNRHRTNRRHTAKLPLLAVDGRVDLAARELVDALAVLPFRQRAVLVLRYHFSLSEREIAETLGCRPGTVKSLAVRGLARLRKDLTS